MDENRFMARVRMIGRGRGLAGAATVMVCFVISCGGQGGEAERADRSGAAAEAVAAPPAVSAGPTAPGARAEAVGVRVAMFSIAFHARLAQSVGLPPNLHLLPLDVAVRTVAGAKGRFAEFDRRRAIAILASAGPERFRAALEQLDAPVDDLIELVEEHRMLEEPALTRLLVHSMDTLGPAVDGCAFTIVEHAAVDTVVGPLALQPGCPTLSGIDMKGVVVGTTTMKATGPFDEVPALMDPQNWDVCTPDYFKATYITEVDSADDAIVDGSTHDALEDHGAPSAGTTWKRILFERFVIDWFEIGGLSVRSALWNTLDIDSKVTSDSYSALYCLDRSIWHEIPTGIPGTEAGPGGIDVDEGISTASFDAASGEISFKGVKHIHFKGLPFLYDGYINALTPIFMELAGGEIEKMLCCEIPAGEPAPLGAPSAPNLIP